MNPIQDSNSPSNIQQHFQMPHYQNIQIPFIPHYKPEQFPFMRACYYYNPLARFGTNNLLVQPFFYINQNYLQNQNNNAKDAILINSEEENEKGQQKEPQNSDLYLSPPFYPPQLTTHRQEQNKNTSTPIKQKKTRKPRTINKNKSNQHSPPPAVIIRSLDLDLLQKNDQIYDDEKIKKPIKQQPAPKIIPPPPPKRQRRTTNSECSRYNLRTFVNVIQTSEMHDSISPSKCQPQKPKNTRIGYQALITREMPLQVSLIKRYSCNKISNEQSKLTHCSLKLRKVTQIAMMRISDRSYNFASTIMRWLYSYSRKHKICQVDTLKVLFIKFFIPDLHSYRISEAEEK